MFKGKFAWYQDAWHPANEATIRRCGVLDFGRILAVRILPAFCFSVPVLLRAGTKNFGLMAKLPETKF